MEAKGLDYWIGLMRGEEHEKRKGIFLSAFFTVIELEAERDLEKFTSKLKYCIDSEDAVFMFWSEIRYLDLPVRHQILKSEPQKDPHTLEKHIAHLIAMFDGWCVCNYIRSRYYSSNDVMQSQDGTLH